METSDSVFNEKRDKGKNILFPLPLKNLRRFLNSNWFVNLLVNVQGLP